MPEVVLPEWASYKDGFVHVDPAVVYPLFLKRLGVKKPDQYWLEVSRRCFTTTLKDLIGKPFNLRITKDADWRLDKHPEGDGAAAGGDNFRKHYNAIKANP